MQGDPDSLEAQGKCPDFTDKISGRRGATCIQNRGFGIAPRLPPASSLPRPGHLPKTSVDSGGGL